MSDEASHISAAVLIGMINIESSYPLFWPKVNTTSATPQWLHPSIVRIKKSLEKVT